MYTIDRTNPANIPITVDMSSVKKQAGISWVGQYHSRYGELLHENTLRLLENFASNQPPEIGDDPGLPFNKLNGMLWYDTNEPHTSVGNLKIQNGRLPSVNGGWKRLEVIISPTAPTLHTHGELFFDTTDLTLAISRGNRWDNITVKKAIDSDLLDGLNSTQFLRRDVDDSLLGNINTSNMYPRSNKTFDIGTPSFMYRNAYLSNIVVETTHDLTPKTDDTYVIGTASRRYKEVNTSLIKSNSFTDVSPLTNNLYNLGSDSRRWANGFIVTVDATNYKSILPFNVSSTIGTVGNRWSSVSVNEIDALTTKSLIPTTNNTFSLGDSTRKFSTLDLMLLKETRSETITPNIDNVFNIGSPARKYNSGYFNNLFGDLVLHDNINFTINADSISKGITWSGLTDTHRIYVEELASGTETTRLVIHSGDNMDTDGLVIRQSSSVVTKDVIDVKYSKVTVNAGTLTNKGHIDIESTTSNKGCRQTFNESTGTLMFIFY